MEANINKTIFEPKSIESKIYFSRIKHIDYKPQKTLIILPGLFNYHSFYEKFARFLVSQEKEICCLIMDYAGFGQSSGRRGQLGDLEALDLYISEFIRDFSKTDKTLVLGHGVGALFAIKYQLSSKLVDGLILAAPAFDLNGLNKKVKKILKLRPMQGSSLKVALNISGQDFSSLDEVVTKYDTDYLCQKSFTLKTYFDLIEYSKKIKREAGFIDRPTLILDPENDQIIDRKSIKSFYVGVLANLRQSICFKGMKHDVFNEKESVNVYTEVLNWIDKI